jgi:uncharacterized membrane protein HdeD (DUF308 family)
MIASKIENWLHDKVHKAANQLMWLGVALLVLGVVALVFPFFSTLVITLFVGWLLILSGLLSLYTAFSIRGAGPFFGALLYSLLSIAAGVFILARPVGGELAVTLALGALFVVQGTYELYFAFELKPLRGWGWMVASGLASIVLSLIILMGLPVSSLVTLGIILGVNFVSSGLALVIVGGAARKEFDAKVAPHA